MNETHPIRRKRRQQAVLSGCADARLAGVLSRCGIRLRGLSGYDPLGIRRTRTGDLWHQVIASNDQHLLQYHEPEQDHLRCRTT